MNWRNLEFQRSESGEKPDNRQSASRSRLQPTRANQRQSSAVKHDFTRPVETVSPRRAHQVWSYGEEVEVAQFM